MGIFGVDRRLDDTSGKTLDNLVGKNDQYLVNDDGEHISYNDTLHGYHHDWGLHHDHSWDGGMSSGKMHVLAATGQLTEVTIDQTEADVFKAEYGDLLDSQGRVQTRNQVARAEYETEITDLNGDGKITTQDSALAQKAAQEAAVKRFDELDTDGNGVLTLYEIDKAANDKLNSEEYMANFTAMHSGIADTNGDGTITRSEVSVDYAATFNFIDTNRDGKIDARERYDEMQRGEFAPSVSATSTQPAQSTTQTAPSASTVSSLGEEDFERAAEIYCDSDSSSGAANWTTGDDRLQAALYVLSNWGSSLLDPFNLSVPDEVIEDILSEHGSVSATG